jgi:quinol monooxygenase YgiN
MIVIFATFRIPADKVPTARTLIEKMVAPTREEAGCLSFGVAEDLLEPGLLRMSECWVDQAAIDAHATTPHMLTWRKDRETLGILDRSIQMYEASPIERR